MGIGSFSFFYIYLFNFPFISYLHVGWRGTSGLYFWNEVSLLSPCRSWTHDVAQDAPEPKILLPQAHLLLMKRMILLVLFPWVLSSVLLLSSASGNNIFHLEFFWICYCFPFKSLSASISLSSSPSLAKLFLWTCWFRVGVCGSVPLALGSSSFSSPGIRSQLLIVLCLQQPLSSGPVAFSELTLTLVVCLWF